MAGFGEVLRRLCAVAVTVLVGGAWVTLEAARVRLVDGGMTQGHRFAGPSAVMVTKLASGKRSPTLIDIDFLFCRFNER